MGVDLFFIIFVVYFIPLQQTNIKWIINTKVIIITKNLQGVEHCVVGAILPKKYM